MARGRTKLGVVYKKGSTHEWWKEGTQGSGEKLKTRWKGKKWAHIEKGACFLLNYKWVCSYF
jgi:hypothetical protein